MIKRLVHFLNTWQWILLIILLPVFLFPSSQTAGILLVVPFFWLLILFDKTRLNQRTPLDLPLGILAVMTCISALVTPDFAASLPKLSGMALGFWIFLILNARINSTRNRWIALTAFLLSGLAIAIAGLFGAGFFGSKIPIIGSIAAAMPKLASGLPGAENGFHPNEIAGSLLWVLPVLAGLFLFLLFESKIVIKKTGFSVLIFGFLITGLVSLFVLIVFLLTESRTAYLGLFIGAIFTVPFLIRSKKISLILSLVLIGVMILGGIWFINDQPDFLQGSASVENVKLSTITIQNRIELWDRAVQAIRDFPLTGMGMNIFRQAIEPLYPLISIPPGTDLGHAHNEYLQIALDLGVPGLIGYLSLLISSFWMLRRVLIEPQNKLVESQPSGDRLLARFLAGSIVWAIIGHGVFGLADAVALGAKPGFLFWMLLGFIPGLFFLKENENQESSV